MNFPNNLKYSADHEWVRVEGEEGVIGITDFAQKSLGDVVFLDIDTAGETLYTGERFGTVEAVKTVSDMLMPIDGKVIEVNPSLETAPEKVNKDPYGEGWMIRIQISNVSDLDALMSAAEYEAYTGKL